MGISTELIAFPSPNEVEWVYILLLTVPLEPMYASLTRNLRISTNEISCSLRRGKEEEKEDEHVHGCKRRSGLSTAKWDCNRTKLEFTRT
jgi:hypothetical protein